jgi:dihydrofolate synthase/folylpolyglutamate synthase
MTYPEVIQYLESFINYEKIPTWPYKQSLKLERIKGFLTLLGNPQDSLKCIHVAGTKGKGSSCAFVAYVLKAAGFKVGLYTSPHLSDFRERIRILDARYPVHSTQYSKDFEGMISKEKLASLVKRLKPLIEKYNQISKYGSLSFFEAYTSLAFVYFKEEKIDFAVLETGLGGRLDATNVVNPLVCAITSISYDHTHKLGKTLREITKEKAGIIKSQKSLSQWQAGKVKRQKLIVISAPQKRQAMEVINSRCKNQNVKLYVIGRDLSYEGNSEDFKISGIFAEYPDLKIRLLGRHQLINATVAVGIIEALRFYAMSVDINSIRKGLFHTIWPGRCEVVNRNPLIVLDGAQNISSSRVLKEAIRENFKYKKLILILGISKDKDIIGICRQLSPLADELILTQANNPRAASVDFIEQAIKQQIPRYKNRITKTLEVKEAKTRGLSLAKAQDLVLVCGSLFVVGEFRNGKI